MPYAADPIRIDGRMDDAIWSVAPRYTLATPKGTSGKEAQPLESGEVSFAWDERYFYVAADFDDRDVVAHGDANGLFHHRLGDVCEVFLKPVARPWYCELHVTPRACQTTLVWPGGRPVDCAFEAGVQVRGTLNHPHDRDRGWTAELAVPVSFLAGSGEVFGPDTDWTILIGRYNYSIYLPEPELSSMPPLSAADFHGTAEYASLRLQPMAVVR